MAATKWALLCGGDFYLPPADTQYCRPTNLRGCVRDVHAIRKAFLANGVAPANIKMLTASYVPNNDGPPEGKEDWPIRENIKRELDEIKKKAIRGDLLYFHFSGHGGLRGEIEVGDADEEDSFEGIKSGTALFMTDVFRGGPYLTGHQLGRWLEAMVTEKALRVTAVFDSCHSGGAFRNDAEVTDDVRTLVGPQCEMLTGPPTANAIPKTTKLSHEFAREKVFEGGQRHGAMTYWLVKLLTASNGRFPSHSRAVEYIRRQLSKVPGQTPLAFGDVLYEFFGHLFYSRGETCNAALADSQQGVVGLKIRLEVGRDQGVAVGARYKILDDEHMVNAGQDPQRSLPMVRVYKTCDSHCFATPIPETDVLALGSWQKNEIRHAILDQWALASPVSVHVPFLLEDKGARDRLKTELKHTPGLSLSDDRHPDEAVELTLKLGDDGVFGILHRKELLHRLPKILIKDASWPTKLARVLSHVARYNELRSKYNAATSSDTKRLPRDAFSLTAKPDHVKHGDQTSLLLTADKDRMSVRDLWVSLYCFSDSWKIYKVLPAAGQAAERDFFLQEDEDEDNKLPLTEDFPPKVSDSDPDEVKDLFVFFVSKSNDGCEPPSWGDICLPRLEVDKSGERIQYHALEEEDGEDSDRHEVIIGERGRGRPRNARWTAITTTVYVTAE